MKCSRFPTQIYPSAKLTASLIMLASPMFFFLFPLNSNFCDLRILRKYNSNIALVFMTLITKIQKLFINSTTLLNHIKIFLEIHECTWHFLFLFFLFLSEVVSDLKTNKNNYSLRVAWCILPLYFYYLVNHFIKKPLQYLVCNSKTLHW